MFKIPIFTIIDAMAEGGYTLRSDDNINEIIYSFICWLSRTGLPISPELHERISGGGIYDPRLEYLGEVIWDTFWHYQRDYGYVSNVDITIRDGFMYIIFNQLPRLLKYQKREYDG